MGDSETVFEHQLAKRIGDNGLALEIGKISRRRYYELLRAARSEVWWSKVIF